MKINVGVSQRHVHLTKEVFNQLFDEALTKKYDLHQIGEFASHQVVNIRGKKDTLLKARVVGPFREYNQVEVAMSDAYPLGLRPPVRDSGDLKNSEKITLIGPKGEITLENACILSIPHVHMNFDQAHSLGLKNHQKVRIKMTKEKSGILDAYVKVSDNGFFELHVDRDDANAFLLNSGDEVEMVVEDDKNGMENH